VPCCIPCLAAAPQLLPSTPCTGIENWNQGQCPQEAIWDEGAAILDRSQKGAGWGMAINPVSRRGQHQVREDCQDWWWSPLCRAYICCACSYEAQRAQGLCAALVLVLCCQIKMVVAAHSALLGSTNIT
jgi:hypothetical protein